MLLYSDGAADDRNADGIRFGNENVNQIVERFGIIYPAQKTCQAIYDTLVDFQQGAPQFDDITLLAVRRLA